MSLVMSLRLSDHMVLRNIASSLRGRRNRGRGRGAREARKDEVGWGEGTFLHIPAHSGVKSVMQRNARLILIGG